MFERFTNRARAVVSSASFEARQLKHDRIDTQHVLLGLLDVPDSLALRALGSLGIEAETLRAAVLAEVEPGTVEPAGHVPFTPRAKKILELSLREALQLGHNYIGTEHMLLALLRGSDDVAARVLAAAGASWTPVQQAIVRELEAHEGTGTEGPALTRARRGRFAASLSWEQALRRRPGARSGAGPLCPGCDAPLSEALASRMIETDVDGYEGAIRARTLFVYCRSCGRTIDGVVVPDED